MLTSKGVSKTELAKRAGISKARLSQIMSAEANPTVKTFARLFHAAGVKVEPRIAERRRDASVPQSETAEPRGWETRSSEAALRRSAGARLAADWFGASNDNHLSVESDARTLQLKAA